MHTGELKNYFVILQGNTSAYQGHFALSQTVGVGRVGGERGTHPLKS